MKFALVQLNNRNEAVFYKEVTITKKMGETLGHTWFGNPEKAAKCRQNDGVHAAMYLLSCNHTRNKWCQKKLREIFSEVEMPAGVVDLAIIDL